jgi:hypothetical protein
MGEISKFLPDSNSFGPEIIQSMGLAFSRARAELLIRATIPPSDEAVARAIIQLCRSGEFDPDYICGYVIARFGLDQKTA